MPYTGLAQGTNKTALAPVGTSVVLAKLSDVKQYLPADQATKTMTIPAIDKDKMLFLGNIQDQTLVSAYENGETVTDQNKTDIVLSKNYSAEATLLGNVPNDTLNSLEEDGNWIVFICKQDTIVALTGYTESLLNMSTLTGDFTTSEIIENVAVNANPSRTGGASPTVGISWTRQNLGDLNVGHYDDVVVTLGV